MAMLRDKDSKTALKFLEGRLHKVITTQINDNPRRLTAEEMKSIAEEFFTDVTSQSDLRTAIEQAFCDARNTDDSAVLVCGSLYLASQVREIITQRE